MKTIYIKNLNFIRLPEPVCAAIGNFDGVHLGHQKLIEECKRHGYKSAVLTFYPHPSVFLKKLPEYPLITPMDHKEDILSRLGIDFLIIIEFDSEVAKMTKEAFIAGLKAMNIVSVVCGYDFTFAHKAEGTALDLSRCFEFYEVKKYVFDDVRVSSSYIRELLAVGNVKKAGRLLGRSFSIRGKVVFGSQKGRLIGFPTANVDYNRYFLPKNGVYFISVNLDQTFYYGMCNIGNNPTFNFSSQKRMEVNIFGLDEDIYGRVLEVIFHDRIRDEIQFNSKELLIEQLHKDKLLCYEYSQNYNFTK